MAKVAPSPFDDPKADLQFITSDDVAIRVHSTVLSLAEDLSVFADMLRGSSNDGLPISIPEDSKSFLSILHLIYPGPAPSLNLETINALLPIAEKYELRMVAERCEKALVSSELLKEDPYGVFAVAVHFKLKEVMLAAARSTLERPISFTRVPSPLFQHIPATAYFALMQYRERCKNRAVYFLHKCIVRHSFVSPDGGSDLFDELPYYCPSCHTELEMAASIGPVYAKVDARQYLEYAIEIVKETPSPAAILEDSQLASTAFLSKTPDPCLRCKRIMAQMMNVFRAHVAKEVGRTISEARLNVVDGV